MQHRRVPLAIAAALALLAVPARAQDEARPWLDAALDAARWIDSTAVETEHGLTWPVVPAESERVSTSLYSGSPGVVLFFLELHRSTADAAWLERATAGADHLIATLPESVEGSAAGLYTGVAGVGFTLIETWRSSGNDDYREAALRCVELLHAGAKEVGAGVEWGEATDVVYGGAGVGLFLLDAVDRLEHAPSLELALRAGRRLVELAQPVEPPAEGAKWFMDPEFPRLMPGFSHGTAGVAYFLATLHGRAADESLLEAARDGARYLVSIGVKEDGGFLVMHNEPRDTDLHYLGWCHGPVGTSRLFRRLAEVDPEGEWGQWALRGATSILAAELHEERTPGFWNNVGQCCGSAGVAEYLLDLHGGGGPAEYVAAARALAQDVLVRGTRGEDGLCWEHAEHRVRPDFLQIQTGYMQGAAGIGLALLHLDAFERGREERIRFPDDPGPFRSHGARGSGR